MEHRKSGSFSEFLPMQVTSSHLYHHTFISSPRALSNQDLGGPVQTSHFCLIPELEAPVAF